MEIPRETLEQLSLRDDSDYWRARVVRNRMLGSEKYKALPVLPVLDAAKVDPLRRDLCGRQERYPYRQPASLTSKLDPIVTHLLT